MSTEPTGPADDLAGRTVLVTGATSGIGRDTALGLAARGAHVILACRSADRAREVAGEIAALPGGGSAGHVTVDLADLASVRRLRRARSSTGGNPCTSWSTTPAWPGSGASPSRASS